MYIDWFENKEMVDLYLKLLKNEQGRIFLMMLYDFI